MRQVGRMSWEPPGGAEGGLLETTQGTEADCTLTLGPERRGPFTPSRRGGIAWASGRLPRQCRRGVPRARATNMLN